MIEKRDIEFRIIDCQTGMIISWETIPIDKSSDYAFLIAAAKKMVKNMIVEEFDVS